MAYLWVVTYSPRAKAIEVAPFTNGRLAFGCGEPGIQLEEHEMRTRKRLLVSLAMFGAVAVTYAQQFPMLDAVANKVVQKYQSSTCEQLWQSKGQHGPEEQRLVAVLRTDPQMRQEFFNRIAGPVMNKMFECGMVP